MATRNRIPISTQRGETCVTDTFFTILEFSDTTKDRFVELQNLVPSENVERLGQIFTNLRTPTFGVPFQKKKERLSTNIIRDVPFLAHLQRSFKRKQAFSSNLFKKVSLKRGHKLFRWPSFDEGEAVLAKNLITSAKGKFGTAPTDIGCFEVDVESYGRSVLKTYFNPLFEIHNNPFVSPPRTFGMMISLFDLDTRQKHIIGFLYNEKILCLSDNEVGFLHEIHEPRFMDEFINAYNTAAVKTNIDTIKCFYIPSEYRVEPFSDLEFSFFIPATGFTYGINYRAHPLSYVATLFLIDADAFASVGGGGAAGGAAGRPMNESNTRKSRKRSHQRRKTTRRRRHT